MLLGIYLNTDKGRHRARALYMVAKVRTGKLANHLARVVGRWHWHIAQPGGAGGLNAAAQIPELGQLGFDVGQARMFFGGYL